ncbi:glycogen branching enzyme [Fusobacterium vincentii ATCC 51190]|uniref:1,4-alpha-glucan branching enzyme GlgB n=1 Tax=Fusobacterium vincentii TaxID=155615 RepID=A0AAJ1CSQ7_FUSVC|nr:MULTISPECIES: 1,4-alpha-glucan branching protein GlgB [Fusobacterium]EJG09972.1 glycogen branching enzyme [Fusobacterium vincentii ATCC 51190]ERT45702.1 1,4-alpha-glucan-branching enzyme [Fusobacterium nucleatum CTI-7]MCW0263484.1 1,4-alpha-glucan branching protein GlgB [Fusobacterium vincentii]OHU81569.1 1,4-alpha-glucan branching enzyme [Fusobacterium nucleatum]STO29271.1 1,4-alpha-glucan branching enzyme GlgB [Fusobacterium vincentii]
MSGQVEQYLFHRGEYRQAYEYLGAHPTRSSTIFRIWAPSAKSVAVVGDFNDWIAREEDYCRKLNNVGLWEVEIKKVKKGFLYKYQIETSWGEKILKSDPYAFYSELRPHTASIVNGKPKFRWGDKKWLNNREIGYAKPINIYEVHLGSWKKKEDGTYYNYKEIAELLVKYMLEMNYTHIEIMPIIEYPFDGSWGYQGTGYYSVTSRYGTPEDFMYFVNYFHKNNLGVILDWVPGHFCKDSHGLYRFDGSACYEYEDSSLGENEWGSANFNVTRNEVRSFLLSNLYFWIKEFHIDGIRMDAVSNMLYYRDGLSENKHSVEFLQYINQSLHEEYPDVMLIAEDSSAWPLVTKYQEDGGLGFDFKWNMGWMNDTLKYMEQDPFFRKSHHGKLTFSFMYAFSENFILPLSHDEIVHGKNSILNKMPGYYENKLAHVKNLYSYQMAHPGKKLNFMGNEFVQGLEWRYYEQLEWQLLKDNKGSQDIQKYVKALNQMYLEEEALWHDGQDGFEWIEHENINENMLIFLRKTLDMQDFIIAVFNFSGKDHEKYPLGVPLEDGEYEVILDSNEKRFGGSYQGRKRKYKAIKKSWNYREQYIEIKIAKNSAIFLKYKKEK